MLLQELLMLHEALYIKSWQYIIMAYILNHGNNPVNCMNY